MSTLNINTSEQKDDAMELDNSIEQGANIRSTNECGRTTRQSSKIAVLKIERIDHNVIVKKPGPLPSKTVVQQPKATAGIPREQVKNETADDIDVEVEAVRSEDEGAVELLRPPKKRKMGRGRSETTDKWKLLQAERVERQRMDEEEEMRAKMDPLINPKVSKAYQRMKDQVLEVTDDLRSVPSLDIAAEGLQHTCTLMVSILKSKNLQGRMQADLKEASCYLEAAVNILGERLAAKDAGQERETGERLRKQVRTLKVENQKLHTEMIKTRVQLNEMKKGVGGDSATDACSRSGYIPALSLEQEQAPPFSSSTEEPMEIQEEAGEKNHPPMRPPIKGKTKELSTYPPEVRTEEERRIYDALTEDINRLLAKRGEFMRGNKYSPRTEPPQSKSRRKGNDGPIVKPGAALIEAAQTAKQCPNVANNKTGRKKKEREVPGVSKNPTPLGTSTPKGKVPITKDKIPEKGKRNATPVSKLESNNASKTPLPQSATREVIPWSRVVGRKEKEAAKTTGQFHPAPASREAKGKSASSPLVKERAQREPAKSSKGNKMTKVPKTAAIALTCPEGKYGEVIRQAREKISLAEIGIEESGIRAHKGVTGAMIYEVSGPDKQKKADIFAGKLAEVVGNLEGVRVTRPTKMAEVRLRGIDDATSPEEI